MAHDLPQTADLAAFIAVIEDGGFAEAGRRLGAAPSTLSRTVTRLSAFLLLCIGVQMLVTGVTDALGPLLAAR